MRAVWWILFVLYGAGCASVQRVVECTIEDRQVIADPMADAIWGDVRDGKHWPSPRLLTQIQTFVAVYGERAVRCGLRELLSEWERHGDHRDLNVVLAKQLTTELLERI